MKLDSSATASASLGKIYNKILLDKIEIAFFENPDTSLNVGTKVRGNLFHKICTNTWDKTSFNNDNDLTV